MPSGVVRDETRFIRTGTGVYQPLEKMSVRLGPWGDDVFQSAECRGMPSSFFLEDEVPCSSIAFHPMIILRYIVFIHHLAFRQ